MNIAPFAVPRVLAPLQGLWRRFTTSAAQNRPMRSSADKCVGAVAAHSVTNMVQYLVVDRQTLSKTSMRKPLRIVRILEVGQAPASVGRMVISGRMADVCAELDRLAAGEAALH